MFWHLIWEFMACVLCFWPVSFGYQYLLPKQNWHQKLDSIKMHTQKKCQPCIESSENALLGKGIWFWIGVQAQLLIRKLELVVCIKLHSFKSISVALKLIWLFSQASSNKSVCYRNSRKWTVLRSPSWLHKILQSQISEALNFCALYLVYIASHPKWLAIQMYNE